MKGKLLIKAFKPNRLVCMGIILKEPFQDDKNRIRIFLLPFRSFMPYDRVILVQEEYYIFDPQTNKAIKYERQHPTGKSQR